MLVSGSSEPQCCPGGDLGLNQRFGAFCFPRNVKGQTKVQPCPTATHRTPPHKGNLELFWEKTQEIFDCQERKHQKFRKETTAGFPDLGETPQPSFHGITETLKLEKTPKIKSNQPSIHNPHKKCSQVPLPHIF